MTDISFHFDFNRNLWETTVREIVTSAMDDLAEKLIAEMEKEVMAGGDHGAGRVRWREAMRRQMKVVSKDVSNYLVQYSVGMEDPANEADHIAAMIVTTGTVDPIMAGPKGRTVLTKDLGKKRSSVKDSYTLPPSMVHSGNDWVVNAMKSFDRMYFVSALEDILKRCVAAVGSCTKVVVTRG